MAQLQLDIITPTQTLVHREVDYVSATGMGGEFGIMPGHVPMFAALKVGQLHFRIGDAVQYIFICQGFLEVMGNRVTVLTEVAEMAEDIDVNRADKARERAEGRLRGTECNVVRAKAALVRAVERIHVVAIT